MGLGECANVYIFRQKHESEAARSGEWVIYSKLGNSGVFNQACIFTFYKANSKLVNIKTISLFPEHLNLVYDCITYFIAQEKYRRFPTGMYNIFIT